MNKVEMGIIKQNTPSAQNLLGSGMEMAIFPSRKWEDSKANLSQFP